MFISKVLLLSKGDLVGISYIVEVLSVIKGCTDV